MPCVWDVSVPCSVPCFFNLTLLPTNVSTPQESSDDDGNVARYIDRDGRSHKWSQEVFAKGIKADLQASGVDVDAIDAEFAEFLRRHPSASASAKKKNNKKK